MAFEDIGVAIPNAEEEASRLDDADEDADDWYGETYTDEQWQQWEAQRYGYAVRRSTYHTTAAGDPSASAKAAHSPKASTPATTSSDFVAAEAQAVARGVQRLQKKAGSRPDVVGGLGRHGEPGAPGTAQRGRLRGHGDPEGVVRCLEADYAIELWRRGARECL